VCAIAGIISHHPNYHHSSYLNAILQAMIHRGPDGTKIEIIEKNGCLGHNRLSIIDLDTRATQPMWDQTKRYCLSFNGEIYNFQLLRQELKKLGHNFFSESDSEVLIEAWSEWGMESIHRLIGMFAFAIWDNTFQQLYLIRDRMGEKPLYYVPIHQDIKNGIVFASELKGLLKFPYLSKKISMTALSHYLSFNYTSTADSIFEGVYKLPAASYLHYDLKTNQCKIKEYWSLESQFKNKLMISFHDAQEQLKIILSDTVKEKLIADVPLGAFLSGGLDSAIIVNQMCQSNVKQINTYSIGFKEKSYNEIPLSKKVAKHLGVHHQTHMVTSNIKHSFMKIMTAFDEPFADTSLIPTHFLCEFAKQFVTVSLSGDGGDELFGGYVTYQADRYYHYFRYLPLPIRKRILGLSKHIPTSFNKLSLDYQIKQFLYGSTLNFPSAHLSWREVFSPDQKKSLFRSCFNELQAYDAKNTSLQWFKNVENCHYLDQAMYVDMKTWLVDDIFVKIDRSAMAHSLEVRSPFMDHRLVEFAARIPVEYKIHRNNGKRILKSCHQNQLPSFLLHQSKKGFSCPISYWLSSELFDMAYAITTSSYLCQWFNKKAIEKLWFEHRKGVCDNGYRLFNLLCLGFWCQIYLKGEAS